MAEGNGLLNRRVAISRTPGSNPGLSDFYTQSSYFLLGWDFEAHAGTNLGWVLQQVGIGF